MAWMGELWRQVRYWLSGTRFDADLAEEMRLHVEMRAAAKQAGGMPGDEAQAAARRQFGNATRLHESSREAWGWMRLDSWRQDVTYGLRAMAANPGLHRHGSAVAGARHWRQYGDFQYSERGAAALAAR